MLHQQPESRDHALTPSEPTGAKFSQYFHYGWNVIIANLPKPGEKPQWKTIHQEAPMQPRVLWHKYLDPNTLIGLRFGEYTRYGMVDIDRGSHYHPDNNEDEFRKLVQALETIGLNGYLLVRSSEGKGIHIYFFLPKEVKSFDLACGMKYALEDFGITLQGGQVEIFPNPKEYDKKKVTNYNAHRLPLQAGSYILDPKEFYPLSADLDRFLVGADEDAKNQDMELLEEAIATSRKRFYQAKFGKGSACPSEQDLSSKAQVWLDDLKIIINEGWTGPGQTNDLLREIGKRVVVFDELSLEAQQAAAKGNKEPLIREIAQRIVEIAVNLPGYHQYCNHQFEIETRAKQWAKSLYGYYLPYRSFPERYRNFREMCSEGAGEANNIVGFNGNEQRRTYAREKIITAVNYLESTEGLPSKATARQKAIAATIKELSGEGIGTKTLHKLENLKLWHPKSSKYAPEEPKSEPDLATEDFQPIPDPWLTPPTSCSIRCVSSLAEAVSAPTTPQTQRLLPPATKWLETPPRRDDDHFSSPKIHTLTHEGGWRCFRDRGDSSEPPQVNVTEAAVSHTSHDPDNYRRRDRSHVPHGDITEWALKTPLPDNGSNNLWLLTEQEASQARNSPPPPASAATAASAADNRLSPGETTADNQQPSSTPPQNVSPGRQNLDGETVPPFPAPVNKKSQPTLAAPPATSDRFRSGQEVIWEKCPGYLESFNPFTIGSLHGDCAQLDYVKPRVPLEELSPVQPPAQPQPDSEEPGLSELATSEPTSTEPDSSSLSPAAERRTSHGERGSLYPRVLADWCPGLRVESIVNGVRGVIDSIINGEVWVILDQEDPLFGWRRKIDPRLLELEF